MTLAWNNSEKKNSDLLHKISIPDFLKDKLGQVWQKSYGEIYEIATEEASSLQDDLGDILELFNDDNRTLAHLRYVWMALILAMVVKPTIEYYQSDNSIPDETVEKIAVWLLRAIKVRISYKSSSVEILSSISIFPKKKPEGFQVLYEALDVYINAIKTLDQKQSLEALIDILDDCLEGYAIFPGSSGRRELLNWWLLDVVPATWYLLPPNFIYVVNSLPNTEKIIFSQMKKLEEISSAMWSVMIEAQRNMISLNSQNDMESDVRAYDNFNLDRALSNNHENNVNILQLRSDNNERTNYYSRIA